jgi:hypothetical protein
MDLKALEKLQGTGDPLALFYRHMELGIDWWFCNT